jgi:hypothetical protein
MPEETPAEASEAEAPEETPEETEELGEAGKRALDAERRRAKQAEKELKEVSSRLASFEEASKSEHEKALDAARKEARAEAIREASERVAASEVRAVAATALADPEDATRFLTVSDFVTDEGEVDRKAITSAIDRLIKDKPYLAKTAKAGPLPGAGAKSATAYDFDNEIRRMAKGR